MRRIGADLEVVSPDGQRADQSPEEKRADSGQRPAQADADGQAGGGLDPRSRPVAGQTLQRPIDAIRVVIHFQPPLTHTRAICEVIVDVVDEGEGPPVVTFPQGGGAA
jgi:hypothetical protein